MTNNTHSANVLAINQARRTLNDNLKTRRAVGFSIHQLIKSRNNATTEFEKHEYNDIIDNIYYYVYKPLTESINENIAIIKKSKRFAKDSQHNYDCYGWLKRDTEIQFKLDGEIKYGRILTPVNINEYTECVHALGHCWICVVSFSHKKRLFGKTKMEEGTVTGVTLDEICGYYIGNNYISLK